MKARNIILAAAAAAVFGVLLFLLFEVKGDSEPSVSAEAQARALAEYQRSHPVDDREPPSEVSSRPARERPVIDLSPEEEPPRRKRVVRPHVPSARAEIDHGRERELPRLDKAAVGEDEAVGAEATRYYDKGDYPAALDAALKVLEGDPRNIKMLRVVVSAKCSLNEVESARAYLNQLPRRDQRQMRTRCKNWGVEL